MNEVSYKIGILKAGETQGTKQRRIHILYDHVPKELVATKGALRTKWVFLTVIGLSKQEVKILYEAASERAHGSDELYASHVRAWASLWQRGRIDIRGNLTLARAAYGSLYYLLSSMPLLPNNQFVGLSPSGLPLGDLDKDFQGHVMYDQELWMYPPLLLLHHDLSQLVLGSRIRLAAAAKWNAKVAGVPGHLYPWQSGGTGVELNADESRGVVSPYVSAGVALAVLQYVYATNQAEFVTNSSYIDVLAGISQFLVSKITLLENKYRINGVLPLDESHGKVDDSPFVNAIVRSALASVGYIYSLQKKRVTQFNHYAKELSIPFNPATQMHPAFTGYEINKAVAQADSVLLAYPLMLNMSSKIRFNDLAYYEKVTDRRALPMTWAMHTIGWLGVGDLVSAEECLWRQMLYVRNTFQVWSNRTLGPQAAYNYLSGQGAFLQTFLNGFGGLRLFKDHLDLDAVLPTGVTDLHLVGVDYLGCHVNIFVTKDETMVGVTACEAGSKTRLKLYVYKPEEVHSLDVGHEVRYQRRKAAIVSSTAPLPESSD